MRNTSLNYTEGKDPEDPLPDPAPASSRFALIISVLTGAASLGFSYLCLGPTAIHIAKRDYGGALFTGMTGLFLFLSALGLLMPGARRKLASHANGHRRAFVIRFWAVALAIVLGLAFLMVVGAIDKGALSVTVMISGSILICFFLICYVWYGLAYRPFATPRPVTEKPKVELAKIEIRSCDGCSSVWVSSSLRACLCGSPCRSCQILRCPYGLPDMAGYL